MIVIDASAMVEALVGAAPDPELLGALEGEVAAPHLLDVEVLSVLRGLTLGSKITDEDASAARSRYFALTIERYAGGTLQERIWALRRNLTAYDAAYVALAEGLRAPLFTCDAKLASAGHAAGVRVLPRSV